MRKISLLLAFLLCFTLCGCSKKNITDELISNYTSPISSPSTTSTTSTTSTANINDHDSEFSFSPSDTLDAQGHFEGVKALDYVTLAEYRDIHVPANVYSPTEEAVQEQIDAILQQFAEPARITDVTVQDGDTVNIDYVGSIDGVEFEGGSTKGAGTSVTIGVTTYIDDFLEQLIGHKPGETFNVEVTFPEGYGKENLNGKDAVFVTTINYVEGDLITPELTDEFVAENYAYMNWTTAEDLLEGVRVNLAEVQTSNYLQTYLTDHCQISEIPQTLITYQENTFLNRYYTTAVYYNMTLDEIIQQVSGYESREALLSSMSEDFKDSAGYYLIIQAIAEKEDLTLTTDNLSLYFRENANVDYTEYIPEYGEPYLYYVVMNAVILDRIRDAAILE